ncbi:uncharacterized protein LOC125947812 [Dermacentor silvarum]|uniref:uncharacterized protein LOC125947812 n=1 Tax=Dermacentor silvarum TaxID=543639 RepID=UPI0021019151|nr:uncharacterized protein LOC125947812 [Dermacentor silvarum]
MTAPKFSVLHPERRTSEEMDEPASPRPQSTLACALIVCGVTYLIWTTVKPSASFAAPFLFEAEEASGMMCPNENERLLTRYMDDWEVPLIRRLQNNSDEAPSRAESTSWRVLLKDKVHVFSAYLANATIWGVHVVSLVRRDMKLDNSSSTPTGAIECLIRTADGQSLRTPVLVKKMSEEFHHAFLRTHLICPLQGVAELRKPVSLTLRAVGTASTDQVQLPVQSPPATAPAKCCSVCMRPMHGRTFRLWEVIEFVTHYRMIGARVVLLLRLGNEPAHAAARGATASRRLGHHTGAIQTDHPVQRLERRLGRGRDAVRLRVPVPL